MAAVTKNVSVGDIWHITSMINHVKKVTIYYTTIQYFELLKFIDKLAHDVLYFL
jgi:hypothetical protein